MPPCRQGRAKQPWTRRTWFSARAERARSSATSCFDLASKCGHATNCTVRRRLLRQECEGLLLPQMLHAGTQQTSHLSLSPPPSSPPIFCMANSHSSTFSTSLLPAFAHPACFKQFDKSHGPSGAMLSIGAPGALRCTAHCFQNSLLTLHFCFLIEPCADSAIVTQRPISVSRHLRWTTSHSS